MFTAEWMRDVEYTRCYGRTGFPRGKMGKGYFSWVLKDEWKFSRQREREMAFKAEEACLSRGMDTPGQVQIQGVLWTGGRARAGGHHGSRKSPWLEPDCKGSSVLDEGSGRPKKMFELDGT